MTAPISQARRDLVPSLARFEPVAEMFGRAMAAAEANEGAEE